MTVEKMNKAETGTGFKKSMLKVFGFLKGSNILREYNKSHD